MRARACRKQCCRDAQTMLAMIAALTPMPLSCAACGPNHRPLQVARRQQHRVIAPCQRVARRPALRPTARVNSFMHA